MRASKHTVHPCLILALVCTHVGPILAEPMPTANLPHSAFDLLATDTGVCVQLLPSTLAPRTTTHHTAAGSLDRCGAPLTPTSCDTKQTKPTHTALSLDTRRDTERAPAISIPTSLPLDLNTHSSSHHLLLISAAHRASQSSHPTVPSTITH